MSSEKKLNLPEQSGLVKRVRALRRDVRQIPVRKLARHTGIKYQSTTPGKVEFRLSLLDVPVRLTYPELIGLGPAGDELPLHYQAVLLYYFVTSDGEPMSGEWISFAELPDGRLYNQAFQGYSGDTLSRHFGLNEAAFRVACEKCGGIASQHGGAAYLFYFLPRFPVLVNYWCGDEDFPSACKLLFDRNASHYLPIDVCAIVGSVLTRRLLKGSGASA